MFRSFVRSDSHGPRVGKLDTDFADGAPREYGRRWLACLAVGLTVGASVAAGQSRGRLYSGFTIQNVSNTQSTPIEVSYYDSKMNGHGLVAYGTDMTDRRAIIVAGPQTGGGFATATVADTGPGSPYTALSSISLDDLDNVAFQGTSTDPGIWQGSVIVSSSGPPVVGVINEVVNQGSSTLNTYSGLGSSAGSSLILPYVNFRAQDSAAPDPFTPNVYRARFNSMTSTYSIQHVDTATSTDITVVFSAYGNKQGDFAVCGVQELPDPPFTREACAIVNPDDPSRDTVIAVTGDNVGGSAITGFSGNVVLSADGSTLVAIVNTDAGPGARAVVAYNGFSEGGTTVYIPRVMARTFSTELGLIDGIAVDPNNGMCAWRARLDNLSDQVIQVASTDPTSSQPVLEIVRSGQPLAGTGLSSPVATCNLSPEACSGGGLNQLVFTAVLQDSTQVVAVATLTEDPAEQPSSLPGPVPVGAEQQVNTTTTEDQKSPAVSMADNGDFVVAWLSELGSVTAIVAQRYDATGSPQGSEIAVATIPIPNVASDPDVAVNPTTGDFAVTWRLADSFSANARIQFYDAGGTPVGSPALVVGGEAATTSSPSIAASDNRYAVTMSTTSGPEGFVFYRLYDAAGSTLAFPFPVNSDSPMTGTNPSVTIDGADVSTVTWRDASGQGKKRPVDASGTAQGAGETPISDDMIAGDPQIDANDSGDFATSYAITATLPFLGNTHVIKSFDSNCDPKSDAVPVSSTPVQPAEPSAVSVDDGGTAAGVWVGPGGADIRANWIASNGVVSTGEYALTDAQPGKRGEPDVDANGSGKAAVVYRTDDQDGDAGGVYVVLIDGQHAILGGEFQVNVTTSGDQNSPAIAASDAGDIVTTHVYTTTNTIAYRRLDADGNPLSSELTVNTITGINSDPTVARNAAGLSNVAWQQDSTHIWSQYFDASDVPVGVNFQVNQTPTGTLSQVSKVMYDNGDAFYAWDRSSPPTIVARKFASSGTPLTDEIQLSDFGGDTDPVLALNEDLGRIVACYDANSVYGQVLDLNGNSVTLEFQVNTISSGGQSQPAVAALPDRFVVAFTSTHQDGDVYRRYFDYNGVPLGPEVQVNTFSPNLQHEPTIAADANGNHVIGWTSLTHDGSVSGVYGQWFNADGLPQGNEFRLNSTVTGAQHQPALAMLPTSRIAAIWTSAGQDGDGDGIFGRMFHPAPGDLDGDGVQDGADACPNTIPGAPVDDQGCPPLIPGDFDRDGDVDGDDEGAFEACASGPEVPYGPGPGSPLAQGPVTPFSSGPQVPVNAGCADRDFDGDGDVDHSDFGRFQQCISGSGNLGDPACAE